jgi:phosphatidate cytidylyltransferase
VSAVATHESSLPSVLATRVVTAAILIAAVLCALFLLPPWGFGIAMLLIVGAAAHEWAKLIGFASGRLLFVAVIFVLGGALLFGATPVPVDGWPQPIVKIVCGIATAFWVAVGTPSVLFDWQPQRASTRAFAAVVVLLGAFVAVVELQARSPWLVLAAMAIVWIADTAAFFAGRRFGRHKLAPRISPGKSWEGALGGIAAVVIYALLLVPLASRAGAPAAFGAASVALWIAFVVVLTALSIIGDLHESLLKRRAGVKDSGTLLPGHGGVLDRIDALLAAMPPVALAALVFLERA